MSEPAGESLAAGREGRFNRVLTRMVDVRPREVATLLWA
jgi:hypothetical protein